MGSQKLERALGKQACDELRETVSPQLMVMPTVRAMVLLPSASRCCGGFELEVMIWMFFGLMCLLSWKNVIE